MSSLPEEDRIQLPAQAAPRPFPVHMAAPAGELSEDQFYALYHWCLNPVLSVADLFHRLREELDRFRTLKPAWQRGECRINLYLFVCALACTVDDYLARPIVRLRRLSVLIPRLEPLIRAVELVLEWTDALPKLLQDLRIRAWRTEWTRCVDQICEILATGRQPEEQAYADFERRTRALLQTRLPERLWQKRMRIPEAYRGQDMAHHDVIALANRFLQASDDRRGSVCVIGLRTAGAYFAPLVSAHLGARGLPQVPWLTIRPKDGASVWEKWRLRKLRRSQPRILVVDDHPDSGRTLKLALEILQRAKVPPERITILVPRHPARPGWNLPAGIADAGRISLIALEPCDFYKARLLEPESCESLCREYFSDRGRQDVVVADTPEVEELNARLWHHYRDGLHVRLKRVFAIRLEGGGRKPAGKLIVAKSTGWGWLGYHGYLTGVRLSGHVPPVVGQRHGLLFSEWIEETSAGHDVTERERVVRSISSYVAVRTRRLRLPRAAWLDNRNYRWTSWDEMAQILRGVYGAYLGRLKLPALRMALQCHFPPLPSLVDGKMRPEEWIPNHRVCYKTDFEHHNFGGGELDISDPAYDLAISVFEHGLSGQWEDRLVRSYRQETEDSTIFQRVLLYKILYATLVRHHAADSLLLHQSRISERSESAELESQQTAERWHQRYLRAHNFLIFQMNRFCAGLLGARMPAWSSRLFFMDVDGVLDRELLGFPHTTRDGLLSLALLRSNGFSVILNTGRSLEHVREYCRAYSLPGGIAEYGSVFVDAVRGRETSLIDGAGAQQLLRFREVLRSMPGVYLDPDYKHSIRAYRYQGRHIAGLSAAEVHDLLVESQCDRLTYVCRSADTVIVQNGLGKGPALEIVKRRLGWAGRPVWAMGDSEQDVSMLRAAQFAYAPSNCSPQIRRMGREARCRVMKQGFQTGLLAAVQDTVSHLPAGRVSSRTPVMPWNDSGDLLQTLLQVADRSPWSQLLNVLDWYRL